MKKWRNYLSNAVFDYFFSIQKKWKQSEILKGFFFAFAQVWRCSSAIRNWAYDKKLLKARSLEAPVISIGNISMGGTGKTPTVFLLCEELAQKDIYPTILTRGYRSKFESSSGVLCADGKPLFSWQEMGDEAYMLAKKLPKNPIWVGKNRYQSASQAMKKGSRSFILDDGLQHRKIHRDFEVITLQSSDLMEEMYFFPRGTLRDSFNRLKTADLVLVQNVQENSQFLECKERISLNSSSPVVGMSYEVEEILDREGNLIKSLKKIPVALFCSIGRPQNFYQTVQTLKADIKNQMYGLDHSAFSSEKLHQFSLESQKRGAQYLICTEKDWVKIDKYQKTLLPILFIKMKLKINFGIDQWKIFIEKISNNSNHRKIY